MTTHLFGTTFQSFESGITMTLFPESTSVTGATQFQIIYPPLFNTQYQITLKSEITASFSLSINGSYGALPTITNNNNINITKTSLITQANNWLVIEGVFSNIMWKGIAPDLPNKWLTLSYGESSTDLTPVTDWLPIRSDLQDNYSYFYLSLIRPIQSVTGGQILVTIPSSDPQSHSILWPGSFYITSAITDQTYAFNVYHDYASCDLQAVNAWNTLNFSGGWVNHNNGDFLIASSPSLNAPLVSGVPFLDVLQITEYYQDGSQNGCSSN